MTSGVEFWEQGSSGSRFFLKNQFYLDEFFLDLPFIGIQASRQKLNLILENKCSPKMAFFQ